MKLFKKPQTEKEKKKFRFLLIGGIIVFLSFVIFIHSTVGIVGNRSDFGKNSIFGWVILIDPQETSCLPGNRIYLVNTNDKTPKRDEIFAYVAKGTGFYKDGTLMAKYMRGIPTDHVSVTVENTKVNGIVRAEGLQVAFDTKVDPKLFVREQILKENEFFMLGLSLRSFDSRYWGTIHEEQIIGRAYPIF